MTISALEVAGRLAFGAVGMPVVRDLEPEGFKDATKDCLRGRLDLHLTQWKAIQQFDGPPKTDHPHPLRNEAISSGMPAQAWPESRRRCPLCGHVAPPNQNEHKESPNSILVRVNSDCDGGSK